MVIFRITGMNVKSFKGSSGIGTVKDIVDDTNFTVAVDERDTKDFLKTIKNLGGTALQLS